MIWWERKRAHLEIMKKTRAQRKKNQTVMRCTLRCHILTQYEYTWKIKWDTYYLNIISIEYNKQVLYMWLFHGARLWALPRLRHWVSVTVSTKTCVVADMEDGNDTTTRKRGEEGTGSAWRNIIHFLTHNRVSNSNYYAQSRKN